MKRKLGYAMQAAPFVGLAIWMATEIGILPMLGVFGGTVAIILWFGVSTSLTEDA
jgi:hypothetical protein